MKKDSSKELKLSKELKAAIKIIDALAKERVQLHEEYVRMRKEYLNMYNEYSEMSKDLHDFKRIVIKTKVLQDHLIIELQEAKVLKEKKSQDKAREAMRGLFTCYRHHGINYDKSDGYNNPKDFKI